MPIAAVAIGATVIEKHITLSREMEGPDHKASLNPSDFDGDGASSCDGDCNDFNSSLNLSDFDGDGISSCDDDCNDFDASTGATDNDGDGSIACSGDCDDNDHHCCSYLFSVYSLFK